MDRIVSNQLSRKLAFSTHELSFGQDVDKDDEGTRVRPTRRDANYATSSGFPTISQISHAISPGRCDTCDIAGQGIVGKPDPPLLSIFSGFPAPSPASPLPHLPSATTSASAASPVSVRREDKRGTVDTKNRPTVSSGAIRIVVTANQGA